LRVVSAAREVLLDPVGRIVLAAGGADVGRVLRVGADSTLIVHLAAGEVLANDIGAREALLRGAPRTVLSETAGRLRDAILSGYFKPGTRLVEGDLCRHMQVSRTSIREALRRLEAEKLVTIVPNKGPSVSAIGWAEAERIYGVRALLEGEAAALFGERATGDEIDEMRDALEAFSRALSRNDPIGRVRATSGFYDVMLLGCGNTVIREMLGGLVARINFLRARSMSRPGRARHSLTEMRRMWTAIAKHDSTVARRAAVEHVRAACAAARDVFESKKTA
jgi:DNA-binding GntR family transcriptional regulator